MRRFLVSPSAWGERVALSPREARHALKVLRLKVGDRIQCFDGQGREALARIVQIDASGCEAALELALSSQDAPQTVSRVDADARADGDSNRAPEVDLPRNQPVEPERLIGQGLPKGEKLEQILQHGTELAMTRLWPLTLSRSVVKLEPSRLEGRLERWQRIGEEASKQCRRLTVPQVLRPSGLEAFCRAFEALPLPRLGLVLYEDPAQGQPLAGVLEAHVLSVTPVWALIGPEGGLSPDEVARAVQAGMIPVTLGALVLRTETASLALLAVLQHELQRQALR